MSRYAPLQLSPAGRRYGCQYDAHDSRDLLYAMRFPAPYSRPPVTDFRPLCGPIKDQGPLGACDGFAASAIREFLYRAFFQYEKNRPVAASAFVASPLFAYYKIRELEGTLADGDCGGQIRSAVRVLNQLGVCQEAEDPYAPQDYQTPPTNAQLTEAAALRAGSYHRLIALEDYLNCLASGFTLLLGFQVPASFETIGANGLMPMPKLGEPTLGGHATHVAGADEPGRVLIIQNSWGDKWGDKGYFYMPFDFAANRLNVLDAWMIHLGPAWGASRSAS
jgi:C1A family cysteine protease